MAVKLSKRDEKLINTLVFNPDGESIEVENPFSGHSCELDPRGVALHDYVKGCEASGLYDDLRIALGLFRKLYPEEYYVLLD